MTSYADRMYELFKENIDQAIEAGDERILRAALSRLDDSAPKYEDLSKEEREALVEFLLSQVDEEEVEDEDY